MPILTSKIDSIHNVRKKNNKTLLIIIFFFYLLYFFLMKESRSADTTEISLVHKIPELTQKMNFMLVFTSVKKRK